MSVYTYGIVCLTEVYDVHYYKIIRISLPVICFEIRKIAGRDYWLHHVAYTCLSVRPSSCLHWTSRLPLEGFSWSCFLNMFRKSVKKIYVCLKCGKNRRTFHEVLCKRMTISQRILLRMRNVADRIVEEIKTHILRSRTPPPPSFAPPPRA
jgi:hypothetical protein